MKKFITFFSFIALAVIAVSFASCSKDEDEPDDPKPEYFYSGSYKVAVTDKIFEYCDLEVVVKYDNETQTFKLDDNTKVSNAGISDLLMTSDPIPGRVKEASFTCRYDKATVEVVYTIHEEGKKKIEAASDTDSFTYASCITLNVGSKSKILQAPLSLFVKTLEDGIKTEANNKVFRVEL